MRARMRWSIADGVRLAVSGLLSFCEQKQVWAISYADVAEILTFNRLETGGATAKQGRSVPVGRGCTQEADASGAVIWREGSQDESQRGKDSGSCGSGSVMRF